MVQMITPPRDTNDFVNKYKRRFVQMRNEYQLVRGIHTDVRDFFYPRSARFEGELINQGSRQDSNIINSNPRFAVRTLGAGMQSGVTSPLRPWFRLGLPDPDMEDFQPVKEWLFQVEQLILQIMGRSNIYDALKTNYTSLGAYGTAPLIVNEDPQDIVRGGVPLAGTYYCATDATGRVNAIARDVVFTTQQAVNKFRERTPRSVMSNFDGSNYETYRCYTHIVQPNEFFDPLSVLPENAAFESIWIDMDASGQDAILMQSGFDDQPFMVPRWDIVGEDIYGLGCGEIAMGDGKQLQLMEKRKLQGVDKNVNPTMVADASLKNRRTSNLPGDTTYVNGLVTGNQGYRPAYQIKSQLNELRAEILAVEERIDEAFFKNLFLLITQLADQPNITATQINTMREEKLLMLGPVLERLNDELLDPLIDRVFNIAQRRGMLPPAPEEIQGQPLKVEYISILAQAQKAMGIGNIERFIGFVGGLAGADPTAVRKLNTMEAIDAYAEGTAIPPKLIRTNDEVEAMIAQDQQQAQMQQAIEAAPNIAKATKDLSDASTEGDNVLSQAIETING